MSARTPAAGSELAARVAAIQCEMVKMADDMERIAARCAELIPECEGMPEYRTAAESGTNGPQVWSIPYRLTSPLDETKRDLRDLARDMREVAKEDSRAIERMNAQSRRARAREAVA